MPMWDRMSADAIAAAYLNGWRTGVQPGADVTGVEPGPLRDGMLRGMRDRREARSSAAAWMQPEKGVT